MDDGRSEGGLTRRDFLRRAGLTTLAGLAGWRALDAAETPPFSASDPAATVVLVRDRNALGSEGSPDAEVVGRMVSEGMETLTGRTGGAAWKHIFRSSDVVGIKFSRCGWMRVPTHQEVIDGVAAGLRTVPISEGSIRSQDHGLPAAECTALVNVTSLKAHPLVGMAAAIKNYINLHAHPDHYHQENSKKLGEIWVRPELKGKTRLVVLDLLTPYFGTGPQIDPRYRADYRGVLLATDPVAADAVALHLCRRLRDQHKGEPWPVTPPPLFLAAAEKEYKLGTADPAKIKLVRVGWTEGALI